MVQDKEFLEHIKSLSQEIYSSTRDIEKSSYKIDKGTVIHLLNTSYATEVICSLRYKNHYFRAEEMGAKNAADEFLEHSKQEQEHADLLLERIHQLKGIPEMSPDYIINNSHIAYRECNTLKEMLDENLKAEKVAIETYRYIVQFIENKDPTTRKVFEQILAVEEEHADDIEALKAEYKC